MNEGGDAPPRPLAGGAGGGRVIPRPIWKSRDTVRAKTLRNSATLAERSLWQYLRKSQVGGCKFVRQEPIGAYFADFLCRAKQLVVEIDGVSHDISLEHDVKRDAFLRSEGFGTIRFTNSDVLGNIEGVVTEIARVLALRPTPGPSRKREGRG